MSALHRELLNKHLPPLPPPTSAPISRTAGNRTKRRDYSPLPWTDFFDRCEDVAVEKNTFRVYSKGETGPILFLLHGGGHSALSWACFTSEVSNLVDCQTLALDLRGHGDSITTEDSDVSADRLVRDVGEVFSAMFKDEDSFPPTVLMGHSMGGAIAVRAAAAKVIPSLVGVAVIDIVEGTAMESLAGMQSFLRSRPKSFSSLDQAIEWSIRSGQLRNRTSAKVSMPGQVKRVSSVKTMTAACASNTTTESVLPEEGNGQQQEEGERVDPSSLSPDAPYEWRIDLSSTEVFWRGWFEGLSKLFLSCTDGPKILILAGVDRLDKDLTIGQMQGKFQMIVLKGCGHVVHEDSPGKVAEIVASFLVRYKLAQPKESFHSIIPAC